MPHPARSTPLRYGGAVLAVLLATAARLALDPLLGDLFPFATLFFAVLIVAGLGGRGPALLATALGALASARFLLPPRDSFAVQGQENQAGLVLYLAVGSGIALLGGALRTARRRAEAEAAEALRQRGQLQATLTSMGDAVVVTDAEGRVTAMNPVAEAASGWTALEGTGRPLGEVIRILNEDTRRPVESPVTRVLREGTVVGLANHTVLIARDGAERPIADSAAPIRDEAGRVIGVVLVFRDVTEKAKAERELRRHAEQLAIANSHLEAVFESVNEGIVVFDQEGNVIFCNEAMARICGYATVEEMMQGLSYFAGVFELSDPDGRLVPMDRWPVSRVLRGETVADWEAHGRRKDTGQEWEFSFSGHPVQGADGRQVLSVVVTRDITGRKATEAALRESERRFRTMADSIPQLAWMARPDGHIDWYNRRWYEYTGTTPEQMEGWGWQSVHDPEVLPNVLERWQASITSGEPFDMVFPLKGADGRFRPFLTRVMPVRGEDGRVAHWFGTNTDISERVAMEEALKEADRRKDKFLATLAHELRNPLAPIRTALHLMGQTGGDGRDREAERAMAERQVVHLARLVDDLMDVARINRGTIELRKEVLDLAAVVGRAVESARTAIDDRGHRLTVELPEGPIRLEADPTRLEQVLWNLLSNAAKYTEPGGRIWLAAGVEGDRAVLRVRDTGIGIAPEVLPQVFDMFVQAERRTRRSQGGLGIGLGLVKSLVELHGGTIVARSEGPGRGTEFVVWLPFLRVMKTEDGDAAPAARRDRPARPPCRRILVVDDNEDAANSLARFLRRLYGQDVEVAYDGPAALEAAERFRPEVILLDIGLPGMSGFEVAERLRRRAEFLGTLIVAVTGWGQEDDKRRSKEVGIDYHLVKPVEPDAVRELIVGASPNIAMP